MADEPPIYDPFVSARRESEPRPSQGPPPGPPRSNSMATWSLVFGVLGFTCVPALGGLLALTLGIAARGEIARAEGRQSGSGAALAGALLGGLNLLASLAGFAALMLLPSSSPTASAPPPMTPPVVVPAPTFTPPPAPTAAKRGAPSAGQSSRQGGVIVTRVGKIDLVDIAGDVSSLGQELDRQRAEAKKDGKTLLLWVVVPDCLPCNGVAASLPDPRMQTALGHARVVRVDARELGPELSFLGIPVSKVPGFALLGDSNRPVDYVNGGEWDDDIARNIAPVLEKFVQRRFSKRREPWRGARRDDETTL